MRFSSKWIKKISIAEFYRLQYFIIYYFLTGRLTAVDQDAGQTLTFTLLNYTDVFLLEGTDSIATFASLDYEHQSLYVLSVRCTDDGNEPESVSLN